MKPIIVMAAILFLVNSAIAQITHNVYDSSGNLIAACQTNHCSYYQNAGVSQTGTMAAGVYQTYLSGIQGKAFVVEKDTVEIKRTAALITDFHGTVVAQIYQGKIQQNLFDAFGNLGKASKNTEIIYTDKHQLNKDSPFYNYSARFYDPEVGRFDRTDPLTPKSFQNWYAYANNNPISNLDPDGRFVIAACLNPVGAVACTATGTAVSVLMIGIMVRDWYMAKSFKASAEDDFNKELYSRLLRMKFHSADAYLTERFAGNYFAIVNNYGLYRARFLGPVRAQQTATGTYNYSTSWSAEDIKQHHAADMLVQEARTCLTNCALVHGMVKKGKTLPESLAKYNYTAEEVETLEHQEKANLEVKRKIEAKYPDAPLDYVQVPDPE